jgi:hypothetical protein
LKDQLGLKNKEVGLKEQLDLKEEEGLKEQVSWNDYAN